MDFDIKSEKGLSTVTITNLGDPKLTGNDINKIFLPIRKAYLNNEQYGVAPTVIIRDGFSDKIVIELFGGKLVSDEITHQYVDDLIKNIKSYSTHRLSADQFAQHLTKQLKVEQVDISSAPRVSPKYARNLSMFHKSPATAKYYY